MMNSAATRILTLTLAILTIGSYNAGCTATKKFLKQDATVADVEIDGEMYSIESSTSDSGRMGVAHLRAHEYKDAIEALETAVKAKSDDAKSVKALAVAYDLNGDKVNARKYYSKANLMLHEPDPLITKRLADLKK